MTGIRAVTFDCWGTLINDRHLESAFSARVRALVDAGEGRLDEIRAEDLLRRAWQEHHRSWVNGIQYGAPGMAHFCTAELGGDDLLCDRLQEAFEEAGRHGTLEALPGAEHALRELRANGIRTALVCDTGLTPGRIVRDFLDELDLLEHLEFCAFSNEIGEPKPSPKIFNAALEAIGSAPEDSAHVGDLLRTDVHGARAVGMKTIRITAINDDLATRFSWDANATFDSTSTSNETHIDEVDDADEIVMAYTELPAALLRLGAAL